MMQKCKGEVGTLSKRLPASLVSELCHERMRVPPSAITSKLGAKGCRRRKDGSLAASENATLGYLVQIGRGKSTGEGARKR